jgi:hypothetical protein
LLVPAANASLVPVVVMSAVGFAVDLLLKVTVAGLALSFLGSFVALGRTVRSAERAF